MDIDNLQPEYAAALRDRQLLDHPFYQRWERGDVTLVELSSYAAQYRHFERALPRFLRSVVAALPQGAPRAYVQANLADEEGDPLPHVELFEHFAAAVGAAEVAPSRAMRALLATYEELLEEAPMLALAGFFAYECQASAVAARKAEGLRRDHGLEAEAVGFWAHHAVVDGKHGAWVLEALRDGGPEAHALAPALRRGADAWWCFLDEREAAAANC